MTATTVSSSAAPPPPPPVPAGLGRIAAVALGMVLLQVTIFPFWRLADGIPDVIAPLVVVVGLMRGPLAGAVTGFGAGLLVELTSPIETLGLLPLLYLTVGWFAGRMCEGPESRGLVAPLGLSVGAALFVQLGFALFQVSLGHTMGTAEFVGSVLIPTLALTALLTPPVLLLARRLLRAPRRLEPLAGSA